MTGEQEISQKKLVIFMLVLYRTFKGGESSGQFRWCTIAKIEL